MRFLSVCIISLWGLALSGAEPVRMWTDLKGRTIEASFIKYSDEKIVITRKDGKSFTLSPALFSAQDQKYLAKLNKVPSQSEKLIEGASIVASVKGKASVFDPTITDNYNYSEGSYSSKREVKEGDILSTGSRISVEANSEVVLLFSNGTITTLGANTQMLVEKFLQRNFGESEKKIAELQEEVSASTLLLNLQVGDLVVDVKKLKKESNFAISTPLGVAGIRGTQFKLLALADATKLSVLSGRVEFASADKKGLLVDASKGVLSEKKKEPVINDLDDAEKESIAKTVAKARETTNEFTLTTLRGKLALAFSTRIVPSIGMEMIFCPPGIFTMGSMANKKGRSNDEFRKRVSITKGFYLGKYELTQAQYAKVIGSNPSEFNATENANRPVENVSWIEAREFLSSLNELERKEGRLQNGWKYVLPTEAEWEYACRAGTDTPYSWGESITSAKTNYSNSRVGQTSVVGKYAPNPWGFHDMHGNILEWCDDLYGTDAQKDPFALYTDPTGPRLGSTRVGRGGSWRNVWSELRSAKRGGFAPGGKGNFFGFRVAFKQLQ